MTQRLLSGSIEDWREGYLIGLTMGLTNMIFISAFALVSQPAAPQYVSAPISEVSLPAFANDDGKIQFEIKSNFPSACFEMGPVYIRYDRDRDVILFHATASEIKGNCENKPTQLSQIVDLGALRSGSYEIRELKSLKRWGSIDVDHFQATANDSPRLELASRTR